MARNRKALPLLEGIRIEQIAAEGQALAHHDGEVIFVPFAAPGDLCTLQVVKKRKRMMQARLVSIEEPSSLRRQAPCSHFTICGGCKWQHIYYSAQLEAKEQQVHDAMERIAKVSIKEWLPIVGSEEEFHYRNKVEFTFSNRKWLTEKEIEESSDNLNPQDWYGLGFHIPGRFDKVLDIKECYIASSLANRIRNFIREYTLQSEHPYTYFDLREQTGILRTMMVRTSSTGEAMLLLSFAENNSTLIEGILNAIKQQFPELTSLLWVLNQKRNDTFADLPIACFSGKDYITERLGGLLFKIGAKSFFQTNTAQAERLYSIVKKFADLSGEEVVYDLYTGTGTIANYLAPAAQKVVGIEYVPEAIEDAHTNSELNGITNTLFFAGDMKDILTSSFIEEHGHPDIIVTDPPRAGMHDSVLSTILQAKPKKIVYVSCNPATQARDVAILVEGGYSVSKGQPVDLFPHTHHVENVLLLEQAEVISN